VWLLTLKYVEYSQDKIIQKSSFSDGQIITKSYLFSRIKHLVIKLNLTISPSIDRADKLFEQIAANHHVAWINENWKFRLALGLKFPLLIGCSLAIFAVIFEA
jgi:hypothetical protein